MSTTLHYGYLSLLKPGSSKVRNKFPLVKQSLTFGRYALSCPSLLAVLTAARLEHTAGTTADGNFLNRQECIL